MSILEDEAAMNQLCQRIRVVVPRTNQDVQVHYLPAYADNAPQFYFSRCAGSSIDSIGAVPEYLAAAGDEAELRDRVAMALGDWVA